MFPLWHIALAALVTAVTTTGSTAGWPRHSATGPPLERRDLVGVGIAAGLGVLLWRLSANTPTLNDDTVPGVSPADVLSAPLAYVATGIYVRLRVTKESEALALAPALAAVVALIVNVVTI